MILNTVYNENCLCTMHNMPAGFVDLIVTSPPYDKLRTYNGFSFDFEAIAKELFRVTKPGGVIVWVVGDASVKGTETGTSFRQALYFMWLGLNLHDTIIFEKSPSFPSGPHSSRYSQCFEYMFILSKGAPKTTNLIMDRVNIWGGRSSFGTQSERLADGSLRTRRKIEVKEKGVRFNIWNYATGKGMTSKSNEHVSHPAAFPEKLAADHISSWSNPGDLVYDPFAGSGTTPKMAALLDRNWIASEVSAEYCSLIENRLML